MIAPMHQGSTTGSRVAPPLAGMLLAVAVVAGPGSAAQLPGEVDVPSGERELGTIELPRRVRANGQALPAGTYNVYLTTRPATPEATGALAALERWVEFRQEDAVVGQEVATIVPAAEIGAVAETNPPASGSSRVEMLRGNDYLRVWIHRDGTHYLIHLTVG